MNLGHNGGPVWKLLSKVSVQSDVHALEDACGANANAAWVLDGATTVLDPMNLPAQSDPQWLVQRMSSLLSAYSPAASPQELLWRVLNDIDREAAQLAGAEYVRFPSAAVVLTVITETAVRVLTLADCHAVAELLDGSIIHIEPAQYGGSRNRHEEAQARKQRNTAGGIWVARREVEAVSNAKLTRLPRARRIVLASDGAWSAVEQGLIASPEKFLHQAVSPSGAVALRSTIYEANAARGAATDDVTILALEASY